MAATKRKLDFRGVKDRSGFRRRHFPEGEYLGKILKVDDHESDQGEGWVYTVQVKNGRFPYYCMTYDKKQLWKVRNLFVAAGLKVPKKLLNVDPNKPVGREVGVVLADDEYEGRIRSAIEDLIPLSEMEENDEEEYDEEVDEEIEEDEIEEDEDDEEEEVPRPKKKKKAPAKKKKKVVEEDDEEIDEDELEEIEVEEL